jgi:hypothetical protein
VRTLKFKFFRILTLGHDFEKGPLKAGCRKSIINMLYKYGGYWFCFVCGLFTSGKEVDMDYSYWLGPDYKKKYKQNIKKTSTIISNHVSWIDSMNIY